MKEEIKIQLANYLKKHGLARFGITYNKDKIYYNTRIHVLEPKNKLDILRITNGKDIFLDEFDDRLNRVTIIL